MIESVIATAIVATAMGVLAGLTSLALATVTSARDRTVSVALAHTKLEALRTTPVPLVASPPDVLDRDVPGWVDYLDGAGLVRGMDPGAAGRVFVRRWGVEAVAGDPRLLTLSVKVGRCATRPGPSGGCVLPPGAVLVSGARSESVW